MYEQHWRVLQEKAVKEFTVTEDATILLVVSDEDVDN